ncbi:collagen alpha-2(I) chain-like [Mustela nigripes]|uniref:collagen alpha-2(I) chain-like n=1 Tax=Mustela nigripes TaxID=77151 RepID=UPI00281620AE|nr:collagen alpha-2(I) chain-like [Mustela nigripes]
MGSASAGRGRARRAPGRERREGARRAERRSSGRGRRSGAGPPPRPPPPSAPSCSRRGRPRAPPSRGKEDERGRGAGAGTEGARGARRTPRDRPPSRGAGPARLRGARGVGPGCRRAKAGKRGVPAGSAGRLEGTRSGGGFPHPARPAGEPGTCLASPRDRDGFSEPWGLLKGLCHFLHTWEEVALKGFTCQRSFLSLSTQRENLLSNAHQEELTFLGKAMRCRKVKHPAGQ